jgi:quinohemoprotein ethanol dehydrogenase
VLNPPPATASAATVATGRGLYNQFCTVCHGDSAVAGGVIPDLRASRLLADDHFFDVVLDGDLKDEGMVAFGSVLRRSDAAAIRSYLIKRANEDK